MLNGAVQEPLGEGKDFWRVLLDFGEIVEMLGISANF